MRGLQRSVRDRPLAAVLATLIVSLIVSWRMAVRDWPWEIVFLVQPVAVLLIWFLITKRGVLALGFPGWDKSVGSAPAVLPKLMGADVRSGAQKLRALWIALLFSGAITGITSALFLVTGATTPMGVWLPRAGLFAALGAVVIGVLATALPEELVYRGVLVRLSESRWHPAVVIAVSSLLFSAAHAANLYSNGGSGHWVLMRLVELAVLGATLTWASLRTGALWIPLGWHAGANLAGYFVELVWVPQTVALWPVFLTSIATALLVIPLVLVLERLPPKRTPMWAVSS
ncbi:CPBP family intramembrane metalloprotease [Kocuria sp. JC486]|uniref:CPBP family intramembrane metalloprotease n=1 Tax=Kocuria soli TaxID=2485125 RepID=A0A3N3ZQB8_9MICC|nr:MULTISPECIES: CPBP family intramembrane glutamic endopeptidase [Kocuria]NHU84936.1 CPBP family intramembrane metalloprotease [Kocuria sp. JC486]ROZ63340.1 CPBP family intramembrane metalloprotease [Kocuria soli]